MLSAGDAQAAFLRSTVRVTLIHSRCRAVPERSRRASHAGRLNLSSHDARGFIGTTAKRAKTLNRICLGCCFRMRLSACYPFEATVSAPLTEVQRQHVFHVDFMVERSRENKGILATFIHSFAKRTESENYCHLSRVLFSVLFTETG